MARPAFASIIRAAGRVLANSPMARSAAGAMKCWRWSRLMHPARWCSSARSMGGWMMLLCALALPAERIAGLIGIAAAPGFHQLGLFRGRQGQAGHRRDDLRGKPVRPRAYPDPRRAVGRWRVAAAARWTHRARLPGAAAPRSGRSRRAARNLAAPRERASFSRCAGDADQGRRSSPFAARRYRAVVARGGGACRQPLTEPD